MGSIHITGFTPPGDQDLRVSVIDAASLPCCEFCGQRLVPSGSTTGGGLVTTGGGTLVSGEVICNMCGGWHDAILMAAVPEGKRCHTVGLYVQAHVTARQKGDPMWVSNWPDSLRLTVTRWTPWRDGGFGTKRRSVYFTGPMGSSWSGIEYKGGNAGDLLRGLRRIKS